jgi:hypothetical protein
MSNKYQAVNMSNKYQAVNVSNKLSAFNKQYFLTRTIYTDHYQYPKILVFFILNILPDICCSHLK